MKANYIVIMLFFVLPQSLIPSPTGVCRVSGKVLDESGNPLSEARVAASPTYEETQQVLYSFCDRDGRWALMGLSPGVWTFTVTAPNHISHTVKKRIRKSLPNRLNTVLDMIPTPVQLKPPLESICQRFLADNDVPGLALGVVHRDQVVYSGGFGVTCHHSSRPVTADTVFNLASVSKLFVTTAILQLANQGLLDLDKPVAQYVPYLELKHQVYRFITIRHLLSHQSGLPRGPAYILFPPQHDSGALERSVRALKNQNLPVNPGGQWQYSNIGFNILGAVIAEVSGQSFEDYMRDHIFLPLEMRNSTYFKWEIPTDRMASPHFRQDGEWLTTIENDHRPYAPCAGLFSTVNDMIQWARAHLNNGMFNGVNLYSPGGFYQAFVTQANTGLPASERRMGLGWFLGTYKGHRLAGHSGQQVGYQSHFLLLPDDELAIIVMINNDESPLQELNARILDLLLRRGPLSSPDAAGEPSMESPKERSGSTRTNIIYNF